MTLQIEYKIKKAGDFESQGKLLHALQVYHDIITLDRNYAQAYIKLAYLYEKLRKEEKAFELLKGYLEIIGEDPEIRLLLGQMLLKHNCWSESAEVLQLFPAEEQPMVLFFLGYAYFMSGEYELAKVNLNSFIETSPEEIILTEANLILAKCNISLELYDEAIEWIKKAEALNRENWEIQRLYAQIYFNQGMFLHAASAVEKAIKLNSEDASLYELAGKSYLKLSDYEKAEANFLKFISASEGNSDVFTCLGLVYLNKKKIEDASSCFEKALTLDPFNEIALDGMKKCSS